MGDCSQILFGFVICMINLSALFTVNSEQSEESRKVQWDSSLRSE